MSLPRCLRIADRLSLPGDSALTAVQVASEVGIVANPALIGSDLTSPMMSPEGEKGVQLPTTEKVDLHLRFLLPFIYLSL